LRPFRPTITVFHAPHYSRPLYRLSYRGKNFNPP
jgi:hypothetical protein